MQRCLAATLAALPAVRRAAHLAVRRAADRAVDTIVVAEAMGTEELVAPLHLWGDGTPASATIGIFCGVEQ